mmetsp:Transcript_36108/g.55066  ORF Transcript_36108/g.55066 Transcript_36108/m.55066 type:complete len:159 (+) Transcript_36108:2724-3200(+)
MQGSIKRCVNSLGLFVIDQRSWHPRGLDVVVATELYAVDSKTMVDIVMALRKLENHNIPSASPGGEELGHANNSLNNKSSIIPEDEQAPSIHDYVAERCEEIRQALLHCPDLVDANVKVLQWVSVSLLGCLSWSDKTMITYEAFLVATLAFRFLWLMQ